MFITQTPEPFFSQHLPATYLSPQKGETIEGTREKEKIPYRIFFALSLILIIRQIFFAAAAGIELTSLIISKQTKLTFCFTKQLFLVEAKGYKTK